MLARPLAVLAVLAALVLAAAAPLAAQAPTSQPRPHAAGAPTAPADSVAGSVPFFPLGSSPLELRGDARPGAFLSAVGRRGIAMGTEDGRFELWTWPIKWLHDFQLAFRIPKYTAPIPGSQVARSVVVRPEGVTIEYAHEQFTVRQHVFVPLDEPALVMLLEVDAVRPVDVVATWVPDIHLAWPAGLGGQYMVWQQGSRAFLFSAGRRRINAFLGSPAVTQASDRAEERRVRHAW